MTETIYLKPLTSWERAQKTREKLPMPLKILTSLKTTAVLGATLGALLNPAGALAVVRGAGKMLVPKTAKGLLIAGVTVPTAIGVLSSSKKAREVVSKTLDPRESVKRGKKIGDIIEDPSKAKDILGVTEEMSLKEKILQGAKTAGKVGAVIAGAGALGVGIKKAKQIIEERKVKKLIEAQESAQRLAGLKQVGFTEPRPVGLGGIPVAVPVQKGLSGAPQSTNGARPIHNVIQISVR